MNPGLETDTEEGDVDAALAEAAVVIDAVYETPAFHNNPMEPHATTAMWEGDDLVALRLQPRRAAGAGRRRGGRSGSPRNASA